MHLQGVQLSKVRDFGMCCSGVLGVSNEAASRESDVQRHGFIYVAAFG